MYFIYLQITELCCLRDDLRQLMGIAQQLEPYIKSITGMMEQIQPEVGRSVNQPAEPQQTADQQQGYIPHSQHQPPTQHQIHTSQTQSKPIYRHVNAPD